LIFKVWKMKKPFPFKRSLLNRGGK